MKKENIDEITLKECEFCGIKENCNNYKIGLMEGKAQQKKEELEFLKDEGCQLEGDIAKLLEEYGVKKNAHDIAFFIMQRLFLERIKQMESKT